VIAAPALARSRTGRRAATVRDYGLTEDAGPRSSRGDLAHPPINPANVRYARRAFSDEALASGPATPENCWGKDRPRCRSR
jgi:hypothetical protein